MRVVGLTLCISLIACKSSDGGSDRALDDAAARDASTCATADLPKIQWPLRGAVFRDYTVTAYTDDDPSPGKRDFMGYTGDDAVTYDGHDGIDIGIGGFERMDEGVPVDAGLDAVVEYAGDGAPDRNTGATPPEEKERSNYVILRAPNGFTVVYWHLRKGSVLVKPGDRVRRGQKIAEVGSSGKSSGPHLHIGASDCQGKAIDMMASALFANPPPYDPPHDLASVRFSFDSSFAPGNVATSSREGQTVYIDYLFSSVHRGDRMTFTAKLEGSTPLVLHVDMSGGRRVTRNFFWQPSFSLAPPGNWEIVTTINDAVVDTRRWNVTR